MSKTPSLVTPNKPTEVIIVGLSLFGLPAKVVGGETYPEVDRVHAHVAWIDESGAVRSGTVPVGHPYPSGQEVAIMRDMTRRYSVGSVLTPDDAAGALVEKGLDRVGNQPRLLQEGTICGWFVSVNLTDCGGPFLTRHIVARRRRAEDGAWRTTNMLLENNNHRWPLLRGRPFLEQLKEAGEGLIRDNDIGAVVAYGPFRGGLWKALPPAEPVPAATVPPDPDPAPAADSDA